jgi:hypothetical protein
MKLPQLIITSRSEDGAFGPKNTIFTLHSDDPDISIFTTKNSSDLGEYMPYLNEPAISKLCNSIAVFCFQGKRDKTNWTNVPLELFYFLLEWVVARRDEYEKLLNTESLNPPDPVEK